MANEAEGLGKTPGALDGREAIVKISGDRSVVVYKWSREKFPALLPLVGNLKDAPTIAEQSVSEKDRELVRGLDFDDVLAISTAASDLNMTEAVLKNLPALLRQNEALVGALQKHKPSNPK